MIAYIIRRTLQSIVVVIIVTMMVFTVMRLTPGDPVLIYLSREQYTHLSQEQVEHVRHEFYLDRPIHVQYFHWLDNLVHGDMGTSIASSEKVTTVIIDALPVTLYLGFISFVFGNIIGIFIGVLAAVRRAKFTDLIVTIISNIGVTIPSFWLAILLIYFLGLKLAWFPIFGFTSPLDNFTLSIKQTILPVICLSVGAIGGMGRQARSSVLEVIRQDYVRTAWSKGLAERRIIWKHVLKNALIPIVTIAGMQLAGILGGSVIVETVFNISGMGRLAVNSLFGLDYPVVQAVVLITAIMITASNFVVDLSYSWLDPRIRYS